MSLTDFAYEISAWPLSIAIREGEWGFALIECVHVLALTFVVGMIAVVDLRLLGIIGRKFPVRKYAADLIPMTWIAFIVAGISGVLLFISHAPKYVVNFAFYAKLVLLMLAGINMLYFHRVTWRTVEQWDSQIPPPRAAMVAGSLSLLLWMGVVFFGRWVGFTLKMIPGQ